MKEKLGGQALDSIDPWKVFVINSFHPHDGIRFRRTAVSQRGIPSLDEEWMADS
jgi:hypothetical protein